MFYTLAQMTMLTIITRKEQVDFSNSSFHQEKMHPQSQIRMLAWATVLNRATQMKTQTHAKKNQIILPTLPSSNRNTHP